MSEGDEGKLALGGTKDRVIPDASLHGGLSLWRAAQEHHGSESLELWVESFHRLSRQRHPEA
eukprot:7334164-Alexandrium_andersonii.AAC.1